MKIWRAKELAGQYIMVKVNRIPWNKGLTKEIDERVKKYSEKKRVKRELRFCECGCEAKFECRIKSK